MPKIIDSDLEAMEVELFVQELTMAQAETVLGGNYQTHEGYPYVYLINVTEGMKKPKNPPVDEDKNNNNSNQKINSIDNSRKIYINGIPLKEKRNITVIPYPLFSM
ncbi:MAG: hypothetical protein RMZ69_00115 [Nostoc sp. ChiQUE01a]|nr:hypothetical protein [Nostoc sp. ChiQUE01a]